MEKARTTFTSSNPEPQIEKTKDDAKKARGDCDTNPSSSHTQFFRHDRFEDKYNTITRGEYFQESESISTSDTLGCVHGPEGKQYTEKGLLKRNFMKNLDPIVIDRKFTQHCPLVLGWDIVQHLEFLVRDPTVAYQIDRLISHLGDLARTSRDGYRIDLLDSLCVIINYLVETVYTKSYGARLREVLGVLFENMQSPVRLTAASDVIKYFETLRNYIGYLVFELHVKKKKKKKFPAKHRNASHQCISRRRPRLEDDDYFDLVSKSLIGLLAMPDQKRGAGTAHLRHTLAAAVPVLHHTTVRLLAVTSSHRFPTFLEIALLLACDSVDNCIEMMKENILENIFYRFNPYFPHRKLPKYDINPADPQDPNIKLGDSSVHMNITLSLLLVLVKTTNAYLEDNPGYKASLPCPDGYAQMCFIWAYRYECRAREHRHQRITLTVIISALLKCFGDRLYQFSPLLMPDILTLTVLTELPPRSDWTGTVNFNTAQSDVQFKKVLMYLCVDFIKAIPYNRNMFVSRYWILGIMYLLDPGLCYLRVRWAPSLYAEIRKTALQALVCVLPMTPPNVIKEYGLIRRIMWYIEWYSESPYELSTLYWCLRVLQVAISRRHTETRKTSLGDLFDTHGIIILIHLCYTLLDQKLPPVEKSQAIISLCLRLLTSSIEADVCVKCAVYPQIKWPVSINALARKSLDVILYSLRNHNILSDRWLVSLLNFIWQGIIWNKEYRALFVANNGVYKLLDLITMTRAPVQCIALALVCDIARAGDAVSQLITWRANLGASNADPILVKRGSTIGGLLAAIFRDDCRLTGVKLNEYGVIQNLDFPLMSEDLRRATADPACRVGKSQSTSVCVAAGDLAGSRMSKAFAILHLLSEDLAYKVSLADEAYNLYKKIQLAPEDESMLVLCSHYLTMKLSEAWFEVDLQCPNLLPQDKDSLEEFCHISKGWAKEIKRQQECVIEKERKKEYEEEYSLYAFLGRVRLNVALDALREVRCAARSADRAHFTHAMLSDAVGAHHRRSLAADAITDHVIRTYEPPLDDQNMTGQYVKVFSINPKEKPKPKDKQRLS